MNGEFDKDPKQVREEIINEIEILTRQIQEYKEEVNAIKTEGSEDAESQDLLKFYENVIVDKVSLYGKAKSMLKVLDKAIEDTNQTLSEIANHYEEIKQKKSDINDKAKGINYKKKLF